MGFRCRWPNLSLPSLAGALKTAARGQSRRFNGQRLWEGTTRCATFFLCGAALSAVQQCRGGRYASRSNDAMYGELKDGEIRLPSEQIGKKGEGHQTILTSLPGLRTSSYLLAGGLATSLDFGFFCETAACSTVTCIDLGR